ncbi:hypothetical protein D3C75_880200 [compost metagenome]
MLRLNDAWLLLELIDIAAALLFVLLFDLFMLIVQLQLAFIQGFGNLFFGQFGLAIDHIGHTCQRQLAVHVYTLRLFAVEQIQDVITQRGTDRIIAFFHLRFRLRDHGRTSRLLFLGCSQLLL